jgi:hypothetical protein
VRLGDWEAVRLRKKLHWGRSQTGEVGKKLDWGIIQTEEGVRLGKKLDWEKMRENKFQMQNIKLQET